MGGVGPIRLALIAITLLLAGCGFRPLYGNHAEDTSTVAELAQIYIQPLPNREGQLVHNALLVRLNPSGQPKQPRYRLDVAVQASEAQTAVASSGTATRDEINYTIRYTLYEGDTELSTGGFDRQFAFDYLPEQYSNISARADVGRRAAEEIANEIRNRMAAYFIRATKARKDAGIGQPPADATQQ